MVSNVGDDISEDQMNNICVFCVAFTGCQKGGRKGHFFHCGKIKEQLMIKSELHSVLYTLAKKKHANDLPVLLF